jgi:hypothetical protein
MFIGLCYRGSDGHCLGLFCVYNFFHNKNNNNLGSRGACACSDAGFSSQNDDRAWGVHHRRSESCYAFLWAKGLNANDIYKETFPVYCGKCLSRKAIHNWLDKFSQGRSRKSQMMPDQVQNRLRQQSKEFYAAGFDALVKRLDKCFSVGGAYVEKQMFPPPPFNITCFTFYNLFTDSPSYKKEAVYDWLFISVIRGDGLNAGLDVSFDNL